MRDIYRYRIFKQCLESAAEILCASQKHLFTNWSWSWGTVARLIKKLADGIDNTRKKRASIHAFHSVPLDITSDCYSWNRWRFCHRRSASHPICSEMHISRPWTVGLSTRSWTVCLVFVTYRAPAVMGKDKKGLVALRRKEDDWVWKWQIYIVSLYSTSGKLICKMRKVAMR
jgi:hypothetical protein